MDITFNDWLKLPPDRRKGGAILRPKALYAFTAVTIEIAMESARLRDDLRRLLPEFDRRVLPDEKRPYLQHALDRMKATAVYLCERRKGLGNRNAELWKRELRITTNRPIFFGGSLCGGSYVEAAMMLAEGIVGAICRMTPEQAAKTDDITPFLPQMSAPNEFTALESQIRQTAELVEVYLSEWPEFDTFLELCVEEFLSTVDRLGIRLPDGQSWMEFITKRHASEAPPSEVSHERHDETAAPGVTGILTALHEMPTMEGEAAGNEDAATALPQWKPRQPKSWADVIISEHDHADKVRVRVGTEKSRVVTAGELGMAHAQNGNPSESFRFLCELLAAQDHHIDPQGFRIKPASLRKKVARLNNAMQRAFGIDAKAVENSQTVARRYRKQHPNEPIPQDMQGGQYFIAFRLESDSTR